MSFDVIEDFGVVREAADFGALERDLDNRRRLLLAGVGDPTHTRYRVDVRHDDSILLRPVVSVLARDLIYAEDSERSRISPEVENEELRLRVDFLESLLFDASRGEHRLDDSCWCRGGEVATHE